MNQNSRRVDKDVSPISYEVVQYEGWIGYVYPREEGLHRPPDVIILPLGPVASEQIYQELQIRRRDAELTSRLQKPVTLCELVQSLLVGDMFNKMLAENVVERFVGKRKALGDIQLQYIVAARNHIAVEPIREYVISATKMQLAS